MDAYTKGETLGSGTFGVVYKATHKETGKVVAVKKIRLGNAKEGVSVTALREVKILRELAHPHVVALEDVVLHKRGAICLIFEYMDSDLGHLIHDRGTVLGPGDVKAYMKAVLAALAACHAAGILHRDVKPDNVLLGGGGRVVLADFGLATTAGWSPGAGAWLRVEAAAEEGAKEGGADPRPTTASPPAPPLPARPLTNQVCSAWYRPPELLYGATLYGPAVDVWAAGCVFAELLLRRPWLPGTSDLAQLGLIFAALGTPAPGEWPGAGDLPGYVAFAPRPRPRLADAFPPGTGGDALDLLARLCALDPASRPSAEEALKHRYFTGGVPATPPADLPTPPGRYDDPLAAPAAGAAAAAAEAAVEAAAAELARRGEELIGGARPTTEAKTAPRTAATAPNDGTTGMTGPVRKLVLDGAGGAMGGEGGAAGAKRRRPEGATCPPGAGGGGPASADRGLRDRGKGLGSEMEEAG